MLLESARSPYSSMNLIPMFLSVAVAAASGGRRPPEEYDFYQGYSYGKTFAAQTGSRASRPRPYDTALCNLVPASGRRAVGDILFHQANPGGPVEIVGTLYGLSPGLHGFHIHQSGNVSDNCKAAGSHFNPENKSHGAPGDPVRHAGDLGNIEADASGTASVRIVDGEISLAADHRRSVVGRAVVVHEKADDLGRGSNAESLKTGNAGARVACCVIQKAEYGRK